MFAMLVACAVAAADGGTTEPQRAVPVITPEQLEQPASLAQLNRTDFVVRFRVKSAAAASRPDKAFILWADVKFKDLYQGEGQTARRRQGLGTERFTRGACSAPGCAWKYGRG